jgi:phospholipid/cholesterol/gamma-HCH transport system permease protein
MASNSWADQIVHSFIQVSTFWGKWLLAVGKLFLGKSFMRFGDLIHTCRDCGASALPIVTLIAFLTGLTMAFVGSVQLEKFNATIYVADLVSLAMVREMGALMVAIVMAGRTGAAFAAELGSMKIREEIDSLRTFGIPAIEFLVLPRTLALLLMTPLLTLYADIVGILGGLTVGSQVMDFSPLHYFEQTQSALTNMWEIYSGLFKSLAFGLIIGLVGCYKGMFTGSNSASLGKSVTSSVVISITLIVVCDAIFEICFSLLGYR